jgi:hypothetical protein
VREFFTQKLQSKFVNCTGTRNTFYSCKINKFVNYNHTLQQKDWIEYIFSRRRNSLEMDRRRGRREKTKSIVLYFPLFSCVKYDFWSHTHQYHQLITCMTPPINQLWSLNLNKSLILINHTQFFYSHVLNITFRVMHINYQKQSICYMHNITILEFVVYNFSCNTTCIIFSLISYFFSYFLLYFFLLFFKIFFCIHS